MSFLIASMVLAMVVATLPCVMPSASAIALSVLPAMRAATMRRRRRLWCRNLPWMARWCAVVSPVSFWYRALSVGGVVEGRPDPRCV